eukprot:1905157-Alexandrium_andersonii.AAC.1
MCIRDSSKFSAQLQIQLPQFDVKPNERQPTSSVCAPAFRFVPRTAQSRSIGREGPRLKVSNLRFSTVLRFPVFACPASLLAPA